MLMKVVQVGVEVSELLGVQYGRGEGDDDDDNGNVIAANLYLVLRCAGTILRTLTLK